MNGEQLPLDFSASTAERVRRARKRRERAEEAERTPSLFDAPPNLDIHLGDPGEAIASASGDADRAFVWLSRLVGQVSPSKRRTAVFDASTLDRVLWVRPPAQITLDATAQAVAKALWAAKIGLNPLVVSRSGRRLVATSPRGWPKLMRVVDAPWPAIAQLLRLGIEFTVADNARKLFNDKLAGENIPVARAGLAGASVIIRATRPDIVESLGLPGLAYDGMKGTGSYRMPLLAAGKLLELPQIELSRELESAVRKATAPVRPVTEIEGLPWTLYPFQARDVALALRIVETTGGVLLAAEMGAGKTTMALAMAEKLDLWPMLVISPLSGFSTWARQLEEMGRSFYLATEAPKRAWEQIASGTHDAVVISYDRLFAFNEVIVERGFAAIIADEIQRIRTPGSRRSRALRQLAGSVPVRIGLSGTPLTNTVADLLPVGSFLVPGEWKPRASEKDLTDVYPGDPIESVAEHLGSMMVRRRMAEVGRKLPKRNDHRIFVDLTPEQRRAIEALEAEAEQAAREGLFDGNEGRMHAFAKLTRLRQIVNNPGRAGIGGQNPKVIAAIELVQSFLASGRKGVVFCADLATFDELSRRMKDEGIGHVGIQGSTPPDKRIEYEKRFKADPSVKVVLCTIQAGSESWSASPTATWLISTAYMYAPSMLAQMEARVYRMNSDPDGPEIEIMYMHATAPGGTLDDRMVEILEVKKSLFAQVVDRAAHVDSTKVHYSLSDLTYLLTGRRDERQASRERDAKQTVQREQQKKLHARSTAHAHKGKNRTAVETFRDDGSVAVTREQYEAAAVSATTSVDRDMRVAQSVPPDTETVFDDIDASLYAEEEPTL